MGRQIIMSHVRVAVLVALTGGMLIDQSTAQVDTFRDAWRWAHFTTASGLPSNTVYGITEATDGTVWASTEAGLAWYDGFIWHPVGLSRGQPPRRNGRDLAGAAAPRHRGGRAPAPIGQLSGRTEPG